MDLQEALALSLKVLADWRVIFIAVVVILVWAVLRYVGSVFHRPVKPAPKAPIAKASSPASSGGKPKGRAEKAATRSTSQSRAANDDVVE